MRVLLTGCAGFIGAATTKRLLDRGDTVFGIDNVNPYYDVSLKRARLERLQSSSAFEFHEFDIADANQFSQAYQTCRPDRVVHLAAQAGVRHSLSAPQDYVDSNITGFLNVLEAVRHHGCEHLVYASTSSVYGANTRLPFSVKHSVDHPLSFYAATKRANELMAHNYASLFHIPCTGLRFFTVYGPWGRPDMALFLFTQKILANEAIQVFNHGHHTRDFTYVEDIVEGIVRTLDKPATSDTNWQSDAPSPDSSNAPYRIYNIGSNRPIHLSKYIQALEEALGREAKKELLPMQPGDVADTFADVSELITDVAYQPETPIEVGVKAFVDWYLDYYSPE